MTVNKHFTMSSAIGPGAVMHFASAAAASRAVISVLCIRCHQRAPLAARER